MVPCILNGKDHDADREGLGRETPTKIKMAGLERTGFVQTNLRRKKLIPERIWIIFFESQLRLLLAAQTIQTSTNKKKCWLKHQLCNTVTELWSEHRTACRNFSNVWGNWKICGSLSLDGLLVVTLESVSTDNLIFVVHGPIKFASTENSKLLGGPEAIAPWQIFHIWNLSPSFC